MIVGIDLGTTNSLIAYYTPEGPVVIPNRFGEKLTPSVVSVDSEGTVYVGKTAEERMISFPRESASLFKRDMGSMKKYTLGNDKFTPTELSGFILKALKEDAEAFLGEKIEEAVISVPAYFNDHQRKATKEAGELAGFRVERIISEPTAAAIAYGLDKKEADTRFLVFDLGGGTFDVSILELFNNIMEVRAVAGDNSLGGQDFTDEIYKQFIKKNDIDETALSDKEKRILKRRAEVCKIQISQSGKGSIDFVKNDKDYHFEMDSDELEKACQTLFGRIRRPIEKSLSDAKLKIKDIDEIILVGGATKLPVLRKFVGRLFGGFPNVGINPDEVVASGVAMHAAMKERNEALREMILTDVCPFTLGTEISVKKGEGEGVRENGHYLPIIERNTVIPVSRTHRVYTASDNQNIIRILVLQGESRFASNNLKLGELEIPVPPGPEGKEAADITFTYDINSILEVMVKVVSTGVTKKVIIKNETSMLTDEEAEARMEQLADLKINPREQEINKYLIARGERLYEEATGTRRERIERELIRFDSALNTQDKREIELAGRELKEFLDNIDDESDVEDRDE
ncbi:molecular chaperone HscC [Eubacterium ruminantium]|uniref:Chaperone protein DnaK n=1 Tax=Eubacterium ruminantium TaxID=42322 RepID=A0A1T4Q8P1_9FIRM|nr:molecular chaperone HscC [Eubacterium ruminantium]SCW66474.1 molecular chaperone HscC [Eubacterium ruminantium]SDN33961.1 molecular chaperone HscC [Eubacterium ruminantium]SKA00123.1 molecular chaperone HscC [Eubacterium ruminantium]